MKQFRSFGLFVFATIAISLSSCSSTSINKLEGDWQLFWLNDMSDPNIYIWQFREGTLTIIQYEPPTPVNPNPQPKVAATAQYKTSAEFTSAVVEISGHVQSTSTPQGNAMINNGKWIIEKIDDEVMRLGTTDQPGSGGSHVIREFSRVQ